MAVNTIRTLSEKALLALTAFQVVPSSNEPDKFGSYVAEDLIRLGCCEAEVAHTRKPRDSSTAPLFWRPRSDLGLLGRRGLRGREEMALAGVGTGHYIMLNDGISWRLVAVGRGQVDLHTCPQNGSARVWPGDAAGGPALGR